MKLRIVEDLTEATPWFKLEKFDLGNWRYIRGSNEIGKLRTIAELLISTGKTDRVVEEFSSPEHPLVDNPFDSAHDTRVANVGAPQ